MESHFLQYLVMVNLSLFVFWLVFRMFLRNIPAFQLNRFILLGMVICSFILPLIQIPFPIGIERAFVINLNEIVINSQAIGQIRTSSGISSFYVWAGAYLMVALTLFIKRFFGLSKLYRGSKLMQVNEANGYKIYMIGAGGSPCSFYNSIFLPEDIGVENYSGVLTHEIEHCRLKHSIDVVFLEAVKIMFWFNPGVYGLRRELSAIHEFQADAGVINEFDDLSGYQKLLINHEMGFQLISVTNTMFQSNLKRRFQMMSANKSIKKRQYARYAFPLITMILLLSFNLKGAITESIPLQENNGAETIVQQKDSIFSAVDQNPEFPGGDEARMKYMIENLKYPEAAKKANIQGMVYVSFVVEKDGSITNCQIVRGVSKELDEEALRVINNMPKWKPGKHKGELVRVAFNVPIKFALSNGSK